MFSSFIREVGKRERRYNLALGQHLVIQSVDLASQLGQQHIFEGLLQCNRNQMDTPTAARTWLPRKSDWLIDSFFDTES